MSVEDRQEWGGGGGGGEAGGGGGGGCLEREAFIRRWYAWTAPVALQTLLHSENTVTPPPNKTRVYRYSYANGIKDHINCPGLNAPAETNSWQACREDFLMQACCMDCSPIHPPPHPPPTTSSTQPLRTFWIHINFLSGSYVNRVWTVLFRV